MNLRQATSKGIGDHRSYGMAVISFLTRYYIQFLLILSVLILGALNPYFRSPANLQNILLQASFAGIGAAGMTLLIVSGAFDLSVAGLLGLCGVMICQLLPSLGTVLTILITLFLGVLLGLLNGLVVTKLRIPAFIATLGMMNIYLASGRKVAALSRCRFPVLIRLAPECLVLCPYRFW